jgi:hypothetical protein
MAPHRRWSRLGALVTIAVLVVLTTGCGDDNAPQDAAPTGPSATYCDQLANADAALRDPAVLSSPEKATAQADELERLADEAPEVELAAALGQFAGLYRRVADAGGDPEAVAGQLFAAAANLSLGAAQRTIDDYLASECALTPGG